MLINKTTSQGKALEIDYINGEFIATVDGVEMARDRQPGYFSPPKQLHVFGHKIGLTKAEGQILISAERAYAATIVIEMSRAGMVAEYNALIEDQDAVYTRAHDRQDARAMQIRESYDAKIEAAAQAIRDYDVAHPEETATRNAERAEAVKHNRWM